MSTLLADTPLVRVLVRNEFLFDQQSGHGEFTPGYMIGFCAIRHRAPSFQILLDNGAMWSRIPLHAVCAKACEPIASRKLALWDCFGYNCTVIAMDALKHMVCTAKDLDGELHDAEYVFTVDWMLDGFSEIPDQHKNHHLLRFDSGHFGMYPNNRIRWKDSSWIDEEEAIPAYKSNTTIWFTEE